MPVPYPKSIILICINEYFERFSFYGIRTSLPIFLKDGLGYDENTAIVIFHLFFMFSYFTPLIGATISDCYIGNYKTILNFTIVYIVGAVVLTLSAIPVLGLPTLVFAVLGLLLISLGSGGIKPCISTFGGDQFKVPMQAVQQIAFFAIFNWIIAAANLSATFVAPMLRSQVSCFGETTCFSLIFLVALAFLILSIVFLVAGRRLYVVKEPKGNVLASVGKCISTALKLKIKEKTSFSCKTSGLPVPKTDGSMKRAHWLDVCIESHGQELVDDIKIVFRLLPLYIPLCFFWALYDQQSSRWTFQATRMDRNMFGYQIEADQFQIVHRIALLALIPIFEKLLYPLFSHWNFLTSQLSRIFWGGIAAAVAFGLSGVVEIYSKGDTTNGTGGLHIGWQLPQFIMIAIAEIMFQISGMEFSYSAAPNSMKSLMQSIWLLTSAFGNLIVVIIAKFRFFEEQEYEFFLFAGLMIANMVLFAFLSALYRSKVQKKSEENTASPTDSGITNLSFEADA